MTSPNPTATGRRPARVAAATVACVGLLAAFAGLSFSAVRTKNATVDEPVHLVAALAADRLGDLRMDPENPPLWKRWAALGDRGLPVAFPPDDHVWADRSWNPVGQSVYGARTLLATPGNDGAALLTRARAMMLVLGVVLAAAVAAWAGRLGGPVAAVAAAAVFCLDPTVVAHAPILKSDLPLAVAAFALAWATWAFGRRATVPGAVLLGVLCGAAVDAKFSGLLVVPGMVALLLARAMGPTPWPTAGGRLARTRLARLGVAAGTVAVAAVVCFTFTWACYGFRYRPAPSPAVRVDLEGITTRARRYAASVALGRVATPEEGAARRPGALDRCVQFADAHRLLPQPLLAGLLYQSTNVMLWPAYLDGRMYDDGLAAYFPLAFLYKTPLATLALVAAVVVVFPARNRWRTTTAPPPPPPGGRTWAAACLVVPAAVFGVAALTAHVNIGLRSVLLLYPFGAVGLGLAVGWAWHHRPRATAAVAGVLLAGLAAETAAAWPDYVPFFNAAVGGPRGGFRHLADSNLDWAQDLSALGDWQRAHPGVAVYADLFATGEPAWYGIDCRPLFAPDGTTVPRRGPAVVAVSATHLRGLYVDPGHEAVLAALRARTPDAVLHGTIYLYRDVP